MIRPRRAAAAVLALGLASGPAAAADPILPLSEVRPGMVGEARTVVRGTEITTFPVTVLDVQRAADGPGGTLVLVRAEGELMERTGGVAEGMSGSPVYVTGADGVPRVMGALAFGAGDQANVIAGVTPIEQMLDLDAGARALERRPAAAAPVRRRAVVVRDRAAAVRLQARRTDRIGLYPLVRWTLAGASRPVSAPLARSLARSGIRLNDLGPRTPRPPTPIVPGATMTVLLAGGDLVLGAIGTATYVDGPRVLGLGHPFLRAGRASFLLGDGYVYQTIAAPILGGSYKLGEPGALQGVVTADRADGVAGRVGPVAGISAVSRARHLTRGTSAVVRATVAADERTAPVVGGLLQDEPVARVADGVAAGTLALRVRITSPAARRPVIYRNAYAAAGDVASLASGQVPRLLAVLMQNGVRSLPISSIRVEQALDARVLAARIAGARIDPRRVRPGQRALLRLRLQPWRARAVTVTVPIRIPAGIPRGLRTLRAIPNATGGFDPLPAALDQEIGGETTPATLRREVARVERLAPRSTGDRVGRLLEGLRRASADRNDAIRLLAPGELGDDPGAGRTHPVPYVIYGGRASARVRVR